MDIGDYIKIAAVLAILAMVATIKVQYDSIQELNGQKTIWEDANKKLADSVNAQNIALRDGQVKFDQAQADLNVAKGINTALTEQYALLRGSIKGKPVAKTCADAIVELKTTSKQIATKWNSK